MKKTPTKADLETALQEIADRMKATKELAIARHAPRLVGVTDEAEAETILAEITGEMLAELNATERDFEERGLTTV